MGPAFRRRATEAAMRRQPNGRQPVWRGMTAQDIFVVIAAWSLFFPTGLIAQESAPRLSLDQALQAALKSHPSLVRANAQVGIAAARIRQAQAGLMPSVTLQGAATDGPLGAPAFGPIGNPANFGAPSLSVQGLAGDPVKKQFGGGLNVTQALLDFGRTGYLVAARRELLRAAAEDVNTQRASVLLGVQQAYFNVLRAQQLAAVQRENLKQREATAMQARLFVESQLKAGVDLQLAEANVSESGVAVIAAQNDVRYAFAALNNAMGSTTMTAYKLNSEVIPLVPEAKTEILSAEEAMRRSLAQRPELKSAALALRSSDQTIRGVRSELLPRLDAIASVGAVNPSGVIQNSKNYAVGVVVSFPLYTGGLVEGRLAEENQRREAVLAQEQELQEAVKLQVAHAWLDVQTRSAQVAAASGQVRSAESSVQLASERYRLQLNSLVELTEAEAVATRARAQLVNARFDLVTAHAVLDWATGETYRRYGQDRKGGRP